MKKKNIITSLLLAVVSLLAVSALPSCRRASHNGKLDGFWKVVEIYDVQTGETIIPDPTPYMSFQLELVQLRCALGWQTGTISYDKGGGTLGLNFPYNPPESYLSIFGIYENPVVFDIETLDHKRLVLANDRSVITCERF